MKKFLKLALIPAAFLVCTNLTSCNISPKEVALITDLGDIDDGSFNQASWEASKAYCAEHNKSFEYYRPFADSDFAREAAVKQAIYKGAKIIICPGYRFSTCVYECAKKYPNIKFLLMDPTLEYFDPTKGTGIEKNTCLVNYKPEISGYLAGYAIATDYLNYDITNKGEPRDEYGFGYMGGMASDGVLQFGFGYIQGIENAMKKNIDEINDVRAQEGKEKFKYPNVQINYEYAHVFAQSDSACADTKGWYSDGIRCVFACGGKLYQSVAEAAKSHNKKHPLAGYDEYINGTSDVAPRDCARWVGVDSDQYVGLTDKEDKGLIITSALKGLQQTIISTLDIFYEGDEAWNKIGGIQESRTTQVGEWRLGLNSTFGDIEGKNYVGIPTATKKDSNVMRGFNNFTIDQYNKVVDYLGQHESSASIVYANNGLDLYKDKDCTEKYYPETYADAKGNPSFYAYKSGGENNVWFKETNSNGETSTFNFFERYYDTAESSKGANTAPNLNIKLKM